MKESLNQILNFFDHIEYTKSFNHFATRYSHLLTRYLITNQDDVQTQKFIKSFEPDKFLKAITYLNKIEKMYKRNGYTLSQKDIQKLLIQFMNNYDELKNAEEDDFDTKHIPLHILETTGINPFI